MVREANQRLEQCPSRPVGFLLEVFRMICWEPWYREWRLQTTMSQSLTSKGKDVEIVKPGLAELPRLPELSQNSAIDVGDWLHGLHNHMGDLSNSSSQWWNEVMGCLTKFYEAYLAASHVGKLALRAVDYETSELKDDKWSRVDKRAASMILASVLEGVKAELLEPCRGNFGYLGAHRDPLPTRIHGRTLTDT